MRRRLDTCLQRQRTRGVGAAARRAALVATLAAAAGCRMLTGFSPDAIDATAVVVDDGVGPALDGPANDLLDDASDDDAAAHDADPTACGARAGGCNIITNAGCAEGTRCGFFTGVDAGALCVPEGDAGVGDRCVSVAECRRGLACLDGRCFQLCCPGFHAFCAAMVGSDAGAPSACISMLRGSDELRACTIPCDPLHQNCRDGMNCVPIAPLTPTCVQAGVRPVGMRCSGTIGQCVVGSVCTNSDAPDGGRVPLCRELCDPRGRCADGGVCEFIATGYGTCVL